MDPEQIDNSIPEHQILQTKEVADNVKNLETPLEGILLKSHQIAENTKPKDVQKISIEGAEIVTIKGEKGDKGDQGDEPADARLQELIKPLIPAPLKGEDAKTPTEAEFVTMLKPFIPAPIKGDKGDQGAPGKAAQNIDEEAIFKKLVAALPKVTNGKPGKNGSPDTPEQVKEKLLKVGLDYDELKGLPDIAKIVQIYSNKGSKTYTTIINLPFVIDGGGQVITTGIKGDLEISFDCTITKVTMLADQIGSIVVDVWKAPYANYPAVVANSIAGDALPTITTDIKSTDVALTGWNKIVKAGDIFRYNVNSVTGIQRVTLSITLTRDFN